jgi:S1-C subfamily serine protease
MPIQVTCSGCDTVYPVPENLAGKTIRCKSCGASMEVVAPAAKAAPAKAVPAKAKPASKPVLDVEEEADAPRPTKAVRRRDDDDDDSPRPTKGGKETEKKKSSMLPLIAIGGVVALLLLGGVTAAGLYFAGVFGGSEVVNNTNNNNTTVQPVANPVPEFNIPGPTGEAGKQFVANTPPNTVPAQQNQTPITKKEPPSTPPTTKGNEPPPSIKPKINTGETTKNLNSQRNALDPATRERLKKATVYFDCTGSNGTGKWSGSGWFGLEENLIWTNAHVMGMDSPGGRPPSKITVYINPGTPQQREIPHSRLELLAVDRERDLALLRVNGEKDLPSPMQIRFSSELSELDNLVILGYPGGAKLSGITGNTKQPAITVNQSSVGSIRRDDFGNISAVQFNGGSAPGGSGGPIVDMEGNVVAVVFMGPGDATLSAAAAFGVPTEYVQGLFAGRVASVEYGQPYRSNGMIKLPVTVKALDPFNKIKQIGVGYWVADANAKIRAPGQERKGIDPSDTGYRETILNYKFTKDAQTATGDLEFPELQAGRVYMAQPFYANAILDKYYLAGNTIKLIGPPVDREPADLIARLKANAGLKRLLTVSDSSTISEFEEGEGADKKERIFRTTELKAYETVIDPKDQGAIATLQLRFDSFTLKQKLPLLGLEFELPASVKKLLNDEIKRVQGFAHVGKDGQVYKTYTDIRAAGPMGASFQSLTNGAISALQNGSVPLPNRRLNPLETWTSSRDEVFFLAYVSDLDDEPTAGPAGPPMGPKKGKKTARTKELKYRVDAKYTYLGTRVRAGQKEAVVKVEAKILPAAGARAGTASGEIHGYVSIDVDTGIVIEADIEREFELDTSEAGIKKRVSGIKESKLTRGTAIRN